MPMTLDAYTLAVSRALVDLKRSDPSAMIRAATATIAFNHALGTSPESTAHQILDDAMTGNGTL